MSKIDWTSLIFTLVLIVAIIVCGYNCNQGCNEVTKILENRVARSKVFIKDNNCKAVTRDDGIVITKTCFICDNNLKYCAEE